MAKQDFLFDLVRALSKPEKRYFKLFASRYKQEGEKKYLSLFRAFERSKSAHQDAIAASIDAEGYDGTLSADKHYLSEMLLSSLRQFHADGSIQNRLGNEMLAASLLRQKGLFDHAIRRLAKVKKEAIEYELPEFVIHAINLECEIRSANALEWPALAESLYDELASWTKRFDQLNQLNKARALQLQLALEKGRPHSEEEKKVWKENLRFFNPEESITGLVSEKLIRLRAYSHAYFVLHDVFAADRVHKENYELYRQHPEQVEKSQTDYLAFLFRYIATALQVQDYKRALQLLAEIKTIRQRHADHPYSEAAVYIDERLLSNELFVLGKMGRYEEMRRLAPQVEQFVKPMENRQHCVTSFNMAVAFMFAGDYHKVLSWTNRSLSYHECKKDYILFLSGNLYQLLAHIELGDFDAAISRAKTARRYVQQRKNETAGSDLALIRFLHRCASTDEDMQRRQLAAEFLAQHGNESGFVHTDEYVGIRSWINALASEVPESVLSLGAC